MVRRRRDCPHQLFTYRCNTETLWRVLGTCGAVEDSKIGRASGAYISGYQEVLVGEAGQARSE